MKKDCAIGFSTDRFRQAMKAAGKTQASLAKEVGVSTKTISRYMSGAPVCYGLIRANIASALNVNILWLIGESDVVERTMVQKHFDKLRANTRALNKDDKLLELVSALAELSEQERKEIAELLGTPTDLEKIEVKHCKAKAK